MKLSVIIPCYNVAPFLNRCLLSITNQSLSDLEIICIDDASTDNTLEVLKMWAKNDLRIRVLENEENMGVGYTRNRGIDAAQGEFVGFVDPDDWIDSDFYKKLIDKAEQTLTPVVCGDIIEHSVLKKTFKWHIAVNKNYYSWWGSWSAVYLRDFLNRYNLYFPRLVIAEDTVFESSVKLHMPKPIIHVRGTAYHYCRRLNGAAAKIWSEKQTEDYISAVKLATSMFNMADNVSPKDYYIGFVKPLFLRLCYAMYTNKEPINRIIACALCDIFPNLKYIDKLVKDKHALVLALLNKDPIGVIGVIKSERWFEYKYKIPILKHPILTIGYNIQYKKIKLFGITILERSLKSA